MSNLDPPLCVLSYINGITLLTSTTYQCEIQLASGGQPTGKINPSTGQSILYDATYIQPQMWIGNFLDGYAFRINSILSISSVNAVNDTIQCVIEDVDGINAKIDPSGGGNGGAPSLYTTSYIFELVDGLPTLSQVQFPPNTTWTDSLVGRFVAYRHGITGPTGPTGSVGATGATGTIGATGPTRKGYYAEFNYSIPQLFENSIFIFNNVENLRHLDFSVGNTVIIQNLQNTNTQFEGIILSYDKINGSITLEKITNIFGSYSSNPNLLWSINLSGPRGAKIFKTNIQSPQFGRIGDYYIDSITGELYLKQ